MEQVHFRLIEPADNAVLARLIRDVLVAHKVPKTNSTYADASLDDLFAYYSQDKTCYYVLSLNDEVVGGGGIAPLQDGDPDTCELQKMYFAPVARGRGFGSRLLELLLEEARKLGYRQCYLETVPQMEAARRLYQKHGFNTLEAPLGNTGHCACPVWMLKTLQA